MHWDLFIIYCAPPNLGIIGTWICRLNFAQRLFFSGLRFFNEPDISDSGPPPEKIHRPQLGLNPRTLDIEASTLPRDHRGRPRVCLKYTMPGITKLILGGSKIAGIIWTRGLGCDCSFFSVIRNSNEERIPGIAGYQYGWGTHAPRGSAQHKSERHINNTVGGDTTQTGLVCSCPWTVSFREALYLCIILIRHKFRSRLAGLSPKTSVAWIFVSQTSVCLFVPLIQRFLNLLSKSFFIIFPFFVMPF